jgi:hypothetical protein
MVAVMCGYSRRDCIAEDVVLYRVKKKATRVGDAGGADVMQPRMRCRDCPTRRAEALETAQGWGTKQWTVKLHSNAKTLYKELR